MSWQLEALLLEDALLLVGENERHHVAPLVQRVANGRIIVVVLIEIVVVVRIGQAKLLQELAAAVVVQVEYGLVGAHRAQVLLRLVLAAAARAHAALALVAVDRLDHGRVGGLGRRGR